MSLIRSAVGPVGTTCRHRDGVPVQVLPGLHIPLSDSLGLSRDLDYRLVKKLRREYDRATLRGRTK